jgi:hypothetical protein
MPATPQQHCLSMLLEPKSWIETTTITYIMLVLRKPYIVGNIWQLLFSFSFISRWMFDMVYLEGVNMFLQLLYVSSQVLGFADNKVEPNATM